MKMMDLRCSGCGYTVLDYLERDGSPPRPLWCLVCDQYLLDRVLLPGASAHVHGDEIDIWVRHGICNEDGSPRHYDSKAEMVRVAKERGVYSKVEHIGAPGSDKNRHTQRFI